MAGDVRRIIVIFVVAILFSILVQVTIDAIKPYPDYSDYCTDDMRPYMIGEGKNCTYLAPSQELIDSCKDNGNVAYKYDSQGCATEAYCETCSVEYDTAQQKYNMIVFIVSAVMGLIAIIAGLYLPQHKNPVNEWMGSGFLLGGIITILVGTVRYFGDMGRYARPITIFFELALIIFLAYRKLGKNKD